VLDKLPFPPARIRIYPKLLAGAAGWRVAETRITTVERLPPRPLTRSARRHVLSRWRAIISHWFTVRRAASLPHPLSDRRRAGSSARPAGVSGRSQSCPGGGHRASAQRAERGARGWDRPNVRGTLCETGPLLPAFCRGFSRVDVPDNSRTAPRKARRVESLDQNI